MRRLALATAAGVAAAALTAGCGGADDPIASYCAEVRAQQPAITQALAAGAGTGLIAALPSFQALQAKAPADIVNDWAIVNRRAQALQQALRDAGVDPAAYDATAPPAGLTADQRAAIKVAADGLLTDDTSQAFAAVQQEALDVCKTPLSS